MDTGLLLGKGYERGSYQTFGNLNLIFDEAPSAIPGDYHRYLDLENALSGVTYSHDGVTYTREYLANYPDNVMAFKLTASEPGKLSFTMNLEPLVTEKITSGKETKVNVKKEIEQDNTLTVTANVKSNNMKLASRVRVLNDGGTLSATENKDIHIDGADSVVLLMTIGTDYKNEYPNYVGEDPLPGVIERIEEATKKGYETLKERHIDDYKKLFDTVRIDLGQFDNGLPTNELLGQYQEGFKAGDLSDSKYREFEMLAYQFGRYALIASSRAGSLPANLQGVWNDNNNPMFSSDYHLNVNLEMNYWEAMNANMGDTMIPLIDYVDGLRAPGSVTAFEYTGIEKGWMTNCSSSPLGYTAPYNHYNYALNPASSAWICANIYDYYLFTGDEQMLRDRIYPIMRGAAEYLSELLVEDPRDGSLVVAPSFSSEHGPVTVGTTYEQSLTYQLFENVIESSKVVGEKDTEFIKKLAEQKERLDPIRIGEWGQIKEWREEDIVEIGRLGNMEGEGEDQHRHTSHLVCLYPLFMVTPETPDEFAAAKVSLTKRGNAQTGWSRAMKMNEWARLLDGKNAMECFSGILAERTLSNMFDTHPPFQIDGTLGLSAGVTEMLLQSHAGYIQPIPALPEEWISGSYEGLMARGNFEVDAEWEENALTLMKVRSNKGKDLKLRYNNIKDSVVVDSKGNRISFTVEDDNTITFTTIEGETYTITPNKRVSSAYQVAAPSEKEEPVPTSYGAAYSIPAGFENIGVADEELPISRVALEGEDEADIRMYYDSAKGDLSFIAYQLPDKNKTAVVQIIDRSNGEVIAQQMIDVKHFSGFQADFKVPANLDGTYEVLISIDRSADYVSRIFTLKSGKDVYDLASLTQEYERTKCLRGIDYTDESWKMLQSTREKALALLEGEKMPSLKEMTTAREQMAYAREKLADRYQTKTLVATSSEVQKQAIGRTLEQR